MLSCWCCCFDRKGVWCLVDGDGDGGGGVGGGGCCECWRLDLGVWGWKRAFIMKESWERETLLLHVILLILVFRDDFDINKIMGDHLNHDTLDHLMIHEFQLNKDILFWFLKATFLVKKCHFF